MERDSLRLISTIQELLGRNSSSGTLYPQKLAMTSPINGVRSRTQATEFSLVLVP
jgi:hypothetical protein